MQQFTKTLNPEAQIRDNAEQFFRIQVAQIYMDKLFDLGQTITKQCQVVLNKAMNHYGYLIKKVVIRDIDPEASVRNAMNDIVASEKERLAQITRAEAEKTVQIKAAEADAEVSRLHGEGIAKQRYAIMAGLKKSVEIFDTEPSAVMSMLMMSQYTDMLKESMNNSQHVSITIQAAPTSAINMEAQIKECLTHTTHTGAEEHHRQKGKQKIAKTPLLTKQVPEPNNNNQIQIKEQNVSSQQSI